jgi:YD repeat-containing protein
MKRCLLFPLFAAFAAVVATGPDALSWGGTIAPCERSDHAITEAECDLKGPVRTAATWVTLPGTFAPNVTSSYTFLAFDTDGHLTLRRTRTNTGIRTDTAFNFSADGRTLTIYDPDERHPVTVITFDVDGHEIKSEFREGDRSFHTTEDEYDSAGRLRWETSYSDPRYRSSNRVEYTYDTQGRLIEEAARSWRVEYEYPAVNVVRELYFEEGPNPFIPRDLDAPDSVPTKITETTNDADDRPVKIVTTMPGADINGWGCDCRMPGVVTFRYDEQGHVLDRTERSPDGALESEDVYVYDANGNVLSGTGKMRNGENTEKYRYVYDAHGNWILKEAYSENPDGTRAISSFEIRIVTYYQ